MASRFPSSAFARFRLLSGLGLCSVTGLISACHRHDAPPASSPAAPAAANPGVPPPPPLAAVPSVPPGTPAPAGGPAPSGSVATLPPLDQLLAPIALYPDPLIALILPSATVPADLGAAAQFVNGHGDPGQIANQPWSDSVKGLAHYPDVVTWMSENMPWTQQLGTAFTSDPAAVMNAIQDLRSRAQAAGTLQSGPQDQIVTDGGAIEIEPAQPDVIYVPRYDPDLVYFAPPPGYDGSYFYWGDPYPMGIWMSYDFNWRERSVWRGDWYDYRREHGGWGRPVVFANVHFSDARRPERWNAPANGPHWPGPVPHDFARTAPMRGPAPPFRDRRPQEAPRPRELERPEGPARPGPEREAPRREERDDRERR
jgi:hypothetical protein